MMWSSVTVFCKLLNKNKLQDISRSVDVFRGHQDRSHQQPRELVGRLGVQRKEDARNLTSLRARRWSPGELEQPQEIGAAKFLYSHSAVLQSGGDSQKKCGGV